MPKQTPVIKTSLYNSKKSHCILDQSTGHIHLRSTKFLIFRTYRYIGVSAYTYVTSTSEQNFIELKGWYGSFRLPKTSEGFLVANIINQNTKDSVADSKNNTARVCPLASKYYSIIYAKYYPHDIVSIPAGCSAF